MRIMNTYIHQDSDGADYFIWFREFDDNKACTDIYALTFNTWWVKEIQPKVLNY